LQLNVDDVVVMHLLCLWPLDGTTPHRVMIPVTSYTVYRSNAALHYLYCYTSTVRKLVSLCGIEILVFILFITNLMHLVMRENIMKKLGAIFPFNFSVQDILYSYMSKVCLYLCLLALNNLRFEYTNLL
jgi:hypothetical protein